MSGDITSRLFAGLHQDARDIIHASSNKIGRESKADLYTQHQTTRLAGVRLAPRSRVVASQHQPTKKDSMIYALVTGNTVIALTNNKNDALRFPEFEIRWATPTEAARYRQLQAAEQHRLWPVLKYRLEVALWWLWRLSFPPMLR
jgi:hypothetical protein